MMSENNIEQKIRAYYALDGKTEKQFPWDIIYNIFIRSKRREVAFFCSGYAKPIRRVSIGNIGHFKLEIKAKKIQSIHLGAYYEDEEEMTTSETLGSEMKFDVDLDEYKRFCKCGSAKKSCSECWVFAKCAMEVIQYVLKRFGIDRENILFFFSGNKGFHCWVLDEKLFYMKSDTRAKIAEIINLKRGMDENYQSFVPQYFIDDIYAICLKYYNEVKKNSPIGARFLELQVGPLTMKRDILYLFKPILDTPVTTGHNHLVKIPMAMHTATGEICVLIDSDSKEKLTYEESILRLRKIYFERTTKHQFIKKCF